MAAPQYSFTNYFGTSDPAGDLLTMIEAQLTNTEWVFVEQVAFTQAAAARVMRVWKNPASLNAAGVDFYVGLVKNSAAGAYFAFRCFEGWNTTTKTIQRPVLGGLAPLANNWTALAYGNGTYVAVGNGTNPVAATSSDGVNWVSRLLPGTTLTYTAIAYGSGLFVAIASNTSSYITSPDGITWTARTLPLGATWSAIAFGGGTFVAVAGASSSALTSPDGITWTTRTLPASVAWSAVTYGASNFVVVANGTTQAATSPTGATWTGATLPSAVAWSAVAYGNGTFVAISSNNNGAATSATGATWTAQTMATTATWATIAYGNNTFLAITASGTAGQTSPDGVTWTVRSPLGASGVAVVFANSTFTSVGNTGATAATAAQSTPDGITWTLGKGLGLVNSVALGDYLLTGATLPAMVEGTIALSVTTNYDIAILVSKSYLAIGVNNNGTGTVVAARVVGLFAPAYSDSVSTNPPLMNLLLQATGGATTSGVSRSMRVPIDANGTATFGIGAGPESLLTGTFAGATKENVSQSIRGSRVALVASSANLTGFTTTGGMRGWLYDCTAVATGTSTAMKVGDTVTIGATVWTGFSTSTATANTGITALPVGYFFNTATGS